MHPTPAQPLSSKPLASASSPPVRVLTIEDDRAVRRGVVDALKFAGYEVIEAGDGEEGLTAALSRDYDLLLLDLVLPRRQGEEILQEVRRVRPAMPVIVLTARGDERDRVNGLRLGADDYVVKPFSVRELLARVEAVLRRSASRTASTGDVRVHGVEVCGAKRELRFADGTTEGLTEREAELLAYLIANRMRVVGREELLRYVWRVDPRNLATRTVDVHVARLREKIRDDPSNPRVLITVHGQGYRLADEP
jgi:DNA-binding response OmpR family regulator